MGIEREKVDNKLLTTFPNLLAATGRWIFQYPVDNLEEIIHHSAAKPQYIMCKTN